MDQFLHLFSFPFTWGLLLGLLVAAFVWKAGFTASRVAKKEIRRTETEMKDLQAHLNTQLKINAGGNEALQKELDSLRSQNENLRVNLASLQQKPGRAETRMLHIYEAALRKLHESAPGFGPAWENARKSAEADYQSAENGLTKLISRVIPRIGSSAPVEARPED